MRGQIQAIDHSAYRLPYTSDLTTPDEVNGRDTVQRRLDQHPEKMRQRRETVEHPFDTIKARMGATHFRREHRPEIEPFIRDINVPSG